MLRKPVEFPFYAKASLFLIGFYITVSILAIGRDFLVPLISAAIIAILFSPFVKFLVRKKINRILAISIVLFIALSIGIGLIVVLASQGSKLRDALPELEEKLNELLKQSVLWFADYFQISTKNIDSWVTNAKTDLLSNTAVGNTLTSLGDLLAAIVLTPVYIFMLLLYQPHLVRFVHKVFGFNNDSKVNEVLTETKTIIRSYLTGLSIEFVIVSVLNIVGLLIIGIDYALILGILAGLMNVIPYLGAFVTMILFALVALITKSPVYVLYIVGMYTFIQIIDNNYIVPKIVGSKVKLNAFISLVVVILGAAIWGIPGMFLSIPLTAIVKLLFDRIEPLKAWGFLLGDSLESKKKKVKKANGISSSKD